LDSRGGGYIFYLLETLNEVPGCSKFIETVKHFYQKRKNHHENHGVHQDVGDLPLLALLEVTLTAKSLQSQGIGNLIHLNFENM
jgi:hypothetical protein